jgi:hypothetical protein
MNTDDFNLCLSMSMCSSFKENSLTSVDFKVQFYFHNFESRHYFPTVEVSELFLNLTRKAFTDNVF